MPLSRESSRSAESVLAGHRRLAPLGADTASPEAIGKFLRLDGRAWVLKGVSYGTFAPDEDDCQYPDRGQVARDFEMMAGCGINTVRVYTPPPEWVLDEAARAGLRMMIGIAWSQHVAFLDDAGLRRRIRSEVATTVRRLAGHPAALLFAVANEVPTAVVRWHGRGRVERFLRELYRVAKDAAPECLSTYVNYPPTEYLELPDFEVASFNVYLHREANLRAYIARLHNLAGNRPLLLSEVGADSLREGEAGQAALAAMQLRVALESGACGAVAYSWTDEWWRGGQEVSDWAFGLVDRERRPKLALEAAVSVFGEDRPQPPRRSWPSVSVVVCAYNAAETLDDCLSALEALTYADVELLLVDDGSTDATPEIAARHPRVRCIRVPNSGLSAARNVGLAEASGEIVAYTDADACVEPEWLTYLVEPFFTAGNAGAGGPNVVPSHDPWLAQCVARAPGGPSHVLLDDRVAEHVPGCNMAFRREVLLALGGFNPIFTSAGDDVDLCWRLQDQGWEIGFAPCALVWHHHRSSIGGYWRQQAGYGEGEAWLQPLHPTRFVGRRALWRGHIYSPLPYVRSLRSARINAGVWGSAPFPSVYHHDAHPVAHLPHTLRWQLGAVLLLALGLAALGTGLVSAAVWALGAGLVALGVTGVKCLGYAWDTDVERLRPIGRLGRRSSRWVYRGVVAWLHFLQPLARTYGRLRGLRTPPRRRPSESLQGDVDELAAAGPTLWSTLRLSVGRSVEVRFWGERWVGADVLLRKLTERLRDSPAVRVVEIDDGWRLHRDFSVLCGSWLWLDLRALVEEHRAGRCLVRVATTARLTRLGYVVSGLAVAAAVVLGGAGVLLDEPRASVAAGCLLATLGATCLTRVWRGVVVLRDVVSRVVADAGLVPMRRPTPEAAEPSNP